MGIRLGRTPLLRTTQGDGLAVEKLDAKTRFLVRSHPHLPRLRAIEMAAVFSGNHNDPGSWWDWADKDKQEELIKRLKRRFAPEKTDKTDPLSILVVMNMLLTGFDAPVEQVLYLDRKIVAHDLLQAVARVNRTCGQKKCDYVVDYIGLARHLNEALKDYDGADTEGALIDISVELPKLLQAQTSSRDRAAQMQHSARYHIIGFSNQNPAFARKMSEKFEEILQFDGTWFMLRRDARPAAEHFRRWYVATGRE